MKACPNEFTLQRLASGGTARWKVRQHVDECPLCLSRLATIREEEDILGRIRRASGSSSRAAQESIGTGASAQPDAPPQSLQPAIDGFRIVRLIAEGGMGRVYEAEQLHPRRPAALKLLRAGRTAAEPRLRMFRREADALARLRHPDIAVVYSAGMTSAGEPYLAMELVQGETLDKYTANHAMWEEDVLRLMARICRAIDHAHEHGVIHRDLKPTNIMVDANGNPKVLDFGLARIAANDAAELSTVTVDGKIAGTLAYMSPEQVCCQAGAVDARSDVYALGVILYQMLTGKLPIGVGDRGFAEIVDAIRTDSPVPPSRHRPELHAEVERIVLRALHKRPQERYQSARELADDIDRRLAGQPIVHRRSAGWSGRRRVIAASVALALVVTGGLVGLGAWGGNDRVAARADAGATVAARETEAPARADEQESDEIHRLGPLITLVGDLPDLERLLRSRVESLRVSPTNSDKDRRAMAVRLALVLERQGEYAEAERLFRDTLESEQKAPHRSAVTQIRIARCVGAQGDHEQAQKMFADCMKLVQKLGPQQASVRTELQVSMARDLMAQDRFDEAKELLDQAGTSGEESIANVKWCRWSVAGAYAEYYRATHEPDMEECWRRRMADVYTISPAPIVCQE